VAKVIISGEQFVKTWQESDSVADVANYFGIEVKKCNSRAGLLRRKGVPLKRMLRQSNVNYDDLTKLAKELLPANGDANPRKRSKKK
jgi:hypothetical protein